MKEGRCHRVFATFVGYSRQTDASTGASSKQAVVGCVAGWLWWAQLDDLFDSDCRRRDHRLLADKGFVQKLLVITRHIIRSAELGHRVPGELRGVRGRSERALIAPRRENLCTALLLFFFFFYRHSERVVAVKLGRVLCTYRIIPRVIAGKGEPRCAAFVSKRTANLAKTTSRRPCVAVAYLALSR